MFLIDTNILSELIKPAPNRGVIQWAAGVTTFLISVISIEEVLYGLHKKPNQKLLAWFQAFFAQNTIIDIDSAIAKLAGSMRGKLAREVINKTQADMIIAATALTNALTLVTRNEKDFAGLGVTILNPFR